MACSGQVWIPVVFLIDFERLGVEWLGFGGDDLEWFGLRLSEMGWTCKSGAVWKACSSRLL